MSFIISFVTATFVIECMSIANAVIKRQPSPSSQLTSPISSTPSRTSTVTNNSNCGAKQCPSESSDRSPELITSENVLSPDTSASFAFNDDQHETQPLIGRSASASSLGHFQTRTRSYDITERVELGQMANMFFPKLLVTVFYICIALYLYGDLAIYSAAIAKSLRDVSWSVLKSYRHRG